MANGLKICAMSKIRNINMLQNEEYTEYIKIFLNLRPQNTNEIYQNKTSAGTYQLLAQSVQLMCWLDRRN